MKVILIPGLGYDSRIFERLNLKGLEVDYLEWIEPADDEHLMCYSERLFSASETGKEPVVIIGYSLGGIVAQAIARTHRIDKIISDQLN